ncbi:hypothetical protein [Rhodococcus sp. IEGM 1330]|uniref:hypothetical protein n=1 Tax=Rhodococcus sp. IEGM 1330 TaxID=3082225 RepID=UPI0029542546|nr:hypothetical protein [Rhodococcus sp. IEGM 1330]MDV8022654.1 hypothetical protein [Rhodococcus sp. IEGM 1330]
MVSPPVNGLDDLGMESRLLGTPWSRIVRGIGLGQNPAGYSETAAHRIRTSFSALIDQTEGSNQQLLLASRIAELALRVSDPTNPAPSTEVRVLTRSAVAAADSISNPYFSVNGYCNIIDALAKLGQDPSHLVDNGVNLRYKALAAIDRIEPDRIDDENRGAHGDYEKVSAWSAIFFAFAAMGMGESLQTAERDCIGEALESLERVPSPFFRGRGGSTMITSIITLGHGDRLKAAKTLPKLLNYLDGAAELRFPPSFPSPMSDSFVRAYPLLTTLISVSASGERDLLTLGQNRIQQASRLIEQMTGSERTHMTLYYVLALSNLGLLDSEIPDAAGFVRRTFDEWLQIDPGSDYFLHGIAYAYLAQLAYFCGESHLITDDFLSRMTGAFHTMEDSPDARANRPYPFAYTLNVLSELGIDSTLYTPHPAYGGDTAFDWFVARLSPRGQLEQPRLYMVGNALLNWALRLRPPHAPTPGTLGLFEQRWTDRSDHLH